jgi:hypothetical protein
VRFVRVVTCQNGADSEIIERGIADGHSYGTLDGLERALLPKHESSPEGS